LGVFNLEDFKAVIHSKNGFAKPNRFKVSLTPPLALDKNNVKNEIEFFCMATNMPGVQLQTSDVMRYGYGPVEKRPFAAHMNSVQMEIMSDGQGQMWKFFNNWIQFIIPHSIENGLHVRLNNELAAGSTPSYPYEISYKNTYVTDMVIIHYNENGNIISTTVLRDAFPSQVSDQVLNWDENGRISLFSVQIEYLDWSLWVTP